MQAKILRQIADLLGILPVHDLEAVSRAVQFARERHEGQKRPGGEPQACHLLRVATRAAEYANAHCPGNVRELVCSALLHDVVEDTETTPQELAELFGPAVAANVAAVSHLEEEEPDELYLSRVAAGGRNAILTKRFDRLDNLATLKAAPQEFRERKFAEVRAALPIWQKIDPEGACEIEQMLNG